MNQQAPLLNGPLRDKLIALQRQCEFRRRLHFLTGFGMHMALLVVIATLFFFWWAEAGLARRLVELFFLTATIYGVHKWLWPLFRNPITLEQVAIYLDEKHPELQNRMVSLVSLKESDQSPEWQYLADAFLRDTHKRLRNMMVPFNLGDLAPERKVWIAAGILLTTPLLWLMFQNIWLPSLTWITHGTPALPFQIQPGDTRVRAGEDLIVSVRSDHKNKAVTIFWEKDGHWQETAMRLGDAERQFFHTFRNVRSSFRYRVRVGTQRSPIYDVATWLPPDVQAVDAVYHYPDYLALPPRPAPNTTDLSTLADSDVELTLTANKPLRAVAMVFEDGRKVDFDPLDGNRWRGRLTADKPGKFHYRLVDRDGGENPFQPTFTLKTTPDTPPSVRIEFPYNDLAVTALEELTFAFKLRDDFGLADYGLEYRVAGREPVRITLSDSGENEVNQADASYFIALEELDVSPGDLITWSVWAKDRKPDRPDYELLQDPYFLEIRPYKRFFREAVSNQGGGMGAGGDSSGDLVTQQKDVLVATWNLRRRLGEIDTEAFATDIRTIREAQTGVQQAVTESPNMPRSAPAFQQLMEALEQSITGLNQAQWPNPAAQLAEATTHQQTAYQRLLQLEPPEQQLQRSQANGMAGSASQRRPQGMDQLEMQRNRKFYEEEKRTRKEQQAAAETLEKIRELAQRQRMINDAIAKLVSERDQQEDPAERQRQLERLQEEAQRNLERLDEIRNQLEQLSPQTAESVRQRLDQAREDMNRGLENLQQDQLQQAQADGSQANRDLQQVEETLQQEARAGTGERVDDLRQTMKDLQQQQQDIARQVNQLGQEKDSPSLSAEDPENAAKGQVAAAKEQLMEQYRQLMEDAAETANLSQGSQDMVSRKLGDWLRQTSKDAIEESIEQTQDMLNLGNWDQMSEQERQIETKLADAANGLDEVAALLAENDLEAKQKALEQLENLERRTRQRGTWSEEDLENFAGSEYREWLDRLENATDLLPPDSQLMNPLTQVRREIEKMRARYRRDELSPQYDLVLTDILEPLTRSTQQLREEVARETERQEFYLKDQGSVPDHYRQQVADYFESLSAAEENP